MTVIYWTEPAEENRAAIYDYLAEKNLAAAEDMDDRFIEAVRKISVHLQIGRIGRVAGTREFVAHESYVIVYEIKDGDIYILALLHTSKKYPPTAD